MRCTISESYLIFREAHHSIETGIVDRYLVGITSPPVMRVHPAVFTKIMLSDAFVPLVAKEFIGPIN